MRIPLFQFELLDPRTFFDAVLIEGIQSAALDQPRINAMLSRTPNGPPLEDFFGFGFFNLNASGVGNALLDTGASGLLLSDFWADLLEVNRATFNSQDVIFGDVGIGGTSDFNVSEPLYMRLANYTPTVDADDIEEYDTTYMPAINSGGPIRTQIGPLNGSALLESVNVIGMPAMTGKVSVFDPKPVDTFADTMRTYLYATGTPFNPATAESNPGIPSTNYQVKLSYVSFDRFTTISPAGAPGPTLRTNPFIGPNPFIAGDTTPPVTVRHGNLSTTGSYLLDTGAAASIISQQQAAAVGVTYAPGTYGTADPQLIGAGNARTFKLTIGGTGGETTLAGFFMESLSLPTVQGDPIEYRAAPVLIGDITLLDPATQVPYTLDGIFGMNFLVATANVNTDDPFPLPTDLTVGAMDWITFDEPNKLLGLQVRDSIPGPEVIDELFEHDFAPQSYYFQFSRNVGASLSLSDLIVTNTTTGQVIPASQMSLDWEPSVNTATLSFPGYAPGGILPDGNYVVHVDREGVEDQFGLPMIADYDGHFFSLNGDANRDRKVDIGDFAVMTSNFNLDEQTWADGDFNLDEIVTIGDFAILAGNFNKELPAPSTVGRSSALFGATSKVLRSTDPTSFTKIFFAPFAGDQVIA